MRNIAHAAAALLAFALAGCAATNGASSATPTVAAAGGATMYCMDGKLNETASAYRCTWAKTMKEACEATETKDIAKSAVAGAPVRGGMCSHGDRVVHVVLR